MSEKEASGTELELLIVRCQLGEREAFEDLVNLWHEPLARFVRRMIGDSATSEDLLQETWLRIVRGIDRLSEPARLVPWLFTIARHVVMDHLRREYRKPHSADLEDAQQPVTEIAEWEWQERRILHEELSVLPPRERETLALFYLQELALRDIATILDIPEGTVKSRLHRARGLLRNRLESKGVTR